MLIFHCVRSRAKLFFFFLWVANCSSKCVGGMLKSIAGASYGFPNAFGS